MRRHWNVSVNCSELFHFISSINSSVFISVCVILLMIIIKVTILFLVSFSSSWGTRLPTEITFFHSELPAVFLIMSDGSDG